MRRLVALDLPGGPGFVDALRRVWDGVTASGTDDHILFMEHPELPEHWRHLSSQPGG